MEIPRLARLRPHTRGNAGGEVALAACGLKEGDGPKKKAELKARPSPTGRYEATRPQAVNLHNGEIGGRAVQIKAI
jgi:hypothetical protein